MPKLIQIRNVPEALHRTLKARAAMAGMTLSDFLLAELRRSVERPTREELLERLERREKVTPTEDLGEAVAAERRSR